MSHDANANQPRALAGREVVAIRSRWFKVEGKRIRAAVENRNGECK